MDKVEGIGSLAKVWVIAADSSIRCCGGVCATHLAPRFPVPYGA